MKRFVFMAAGIILSMAMFSQQFEDPKTTNQEFNGVKVKVGGDFALQLQGLDHSTKGDSMVLYDLVTNLNLPTANLNLDVALAKGVDMHLRTYLSSRHHNEAWVKGGHLKIDNLDFVSEGFLSNLMEFTRITVGLDEVNYGDAHFRRTDNAEAIHNPFVGNYIMDAFTTEAFGEIMVQANGFIGILGLSNGKLNQNVNVTTRYNYNNALSFFGKLGFDKQLNDDLRTRITGSWYLNPGKSTGSYLYGGDRTGARYYSVMVLEGDEDNFRSGRYNPGFSQLTAFQVNPFIKYKGLEFFGIYEMALGGDNDKDGNGSFTQLAGELLYRLGGNEQFYFGGRYNLVFGKQTDTSDERNISRFNLGGGWFLTEQIVTKVEYVQQNYSGDGFNGSVYQGGEFSGFMVEAAISF